MTTSPAHRHITGEAPGAWAKRCRRASQAMTPAARRKFLDLIHVAGMTFGDARDACKLNNDQACGTQNDWLVRADWIVEADDQLTVERALARRTRQLVLVVAAAMLLIVLGVIVL